VAFRSWLVEVASSSGALTTSGLTGLFGAPHLPEAVSDGHQHGQAAQGNAGTGPDAGQGQHVAEDQHRAQADGADAEQDGGGRRDAAGRRPVGRRTRAYPYGVQAASGPFVFDREDDQREEDHEQTRPGRHQQHHADGEDNGTHDGDGDPAEQSDQVHASRMPGAGEPGTHGLGAAALRWRRQARC
jgi:hypothetical protein